MPTRNVVLTERQVIILAGSDSAVEKRSCLFSRSVIVRSTGDLGAGNVCYIAVLTA